MGRKYDKEIPDYGDVIPVEYWTQHVQDGMFTEWDGRGYWVKDEKMCRRDEVFNSGQEDATHVVWFNK